MSGEVMDYDFGPKRNWRRWVWNRLADRVANPKTAVVFYLPGRENYDLDIAVSKGFSAENLIGIERDNNTLWHLRNRGVLCAKGDFMSAAEYVALCSETKVDVFYGDFCAGLFDSVVGKLMHFILLPKFENVTFAFNFMRGREANSSAHTLGKKWAHAFPRCPVNIQKHRGAILVSTLAATLEHNSESFARDIHLCMERGEKYANIWGRLIDLFKPEFHSYMSDSGQVFDSVVFTNWITVEKRSSWTNPTLADCLAGGPLNSAQQKDLRKIRATGKSVRAVLAVRSKRLNDHLLRSVRQGEIEARA